MDNVKIIQIKWEYRAEANLTIDGINLLGQDEWELINILPGVKGGTLSLFKRPIYLQTE